MDKASQDVATSVGTPTPAYGIQAFRKGQYVYIQAKTVQ